MSSSLVSNTEKSQADPTAPKLKNLNWHGLYSEKVKRVSVVYKDIFRKCLCGNLQNQIQEGIETTDTHILYILSQKMYEPALEAR